MGGVAAAAAAFALVFTGCSASSPDTGTETDVARGDTLTIGITQPESMNPAKASGVASMVTCLPYDALIAENSDGSFSPRLATEWGYADDEHKVYELTIREGVTFSDGDPLDAEAVAASINYFVGAGGPASGNFRGMTAVATDEYTVQVTSEFPQPDYEVLFTDYFAGGCIISPTGIANADALETESHGVGPYVIESVEPGTEIVYRANEDYYDQSRVLYDEIVLKVYDSGTAATQALLSGQISFWRGSVSQSWNDLADENGLDLNIGSPNFTGLWIFDQQGEVTPALADARVRQALNYAVDRESIAASLYGPDTEGRVQPANWNWSSFDEELESTYEYDPDKARELLEEAGYGDGFTLPITYFGQDVATENLIQAVASNFADVGVTIDAQPVATPADLVPKFSSGTVSGAIYPNDMRSVFQYVALRHGEGGSNAAALGQVDGELMDLVDAAALENTDEAWRGVVAWLTENAFDVPLVQTSLLYISTPDIDVTDGYIESSGRVDYARFTPAE